MKSFLWLNDKMKDVSITNIFSCCWHLEPLSESFGVTLDTKKIQEEWL